MVLNGFVAEGVPPPVDPIYSPYPYWTQDAYVANPCVSSNCSEPCTLEEAARALNCTPGIVVTSIHGKDLTVDTLREMITRVCQV